MDGLSWILFLMVVSGFVGIYVDTRCRPWSRGLEGFVHGFLFGPVGWILLALYPLPRPRNPNEEK